MRRTRRWIGLSLIALGSLVHSACSEGRPPAPDGLQFAEPVELTIAYRPEDLPGKDTTWLRVAQVQPNGQLGATQFVGHSEGERRVRGKLTHFSGYALVDLKVADAARAR